MIVVVVSRVSLYNTIQYNNIYSEKCQCHHSHFTVSYGKEVGNR